MSRALPVLFARLLLLAALLYPLPGSACTTAVVSGKATADGRPLLWKNRDSPNRHNEVVIFADGKFRVLAVVNAGKRDSVWMGVNEAGFCIENSLSRDLTVPKGATGPGNGHLMKLALQTCETVGDFRRLLEETNRTGRTTNSNFGVIDARGGAALFETGPTSYVMFDANDPQVAPQGYVIRANFATTAHSLPARPTSEQLEGMYSAERYLRAETLFTQAPAGKLTHGYILRHLARDLCDGSGQPCRGTVNNPAGELPPEILTDTTISRTTTVSAAVFHGVKPGENPALTTMWTMLGDPKFTVAVPCWVGMQDVADDLENDLGAELGEIALTLRGWSMNSAENGVDTAGLTGIWGDLWKLEDELQGDVDRLRERWQLEPPTTQALTETHRQWTERAMTAMEQELRQARDAALNAAHALPPANVPQCSASGTVRVAIYDHSDGSANGPKNLLRFLTPEAGFQCQRVTPEQIRQGALKDVDVLIVPGGSGSLQAEKLQTEGRAAIIEFVKNGGGYVGICAGSYLASSHYSWSLGLINARVWDRTHWARGRGTVTLGLSVPGCRLFECDAEPVQVHYAQGPLLVPDTQPELPRYEVLAAFRSEVALKGAPAGAMLDTHAIIRAPFGQGRVICFSPHPEIQGGPNALISAGIRWAAGN